MESDRIAVIAKRPRVSLAALFAAAGVGPASPRTQLSRRKSSSSTTAILRESARRPARLAELAAFVLPPDLPYLDLRSLATESASKLDRVRPGSLAQASARTGCHAQRSHNLVLEATRWRSPGCLGSECCSSRERMLFRFT